MRLLWEEEAWEDYCLWQTRDKKLLKRINSLIKDIQRNTYEGCLLYTSDAADEL